MAIKKFYSNKEKAGWKYDERKKQFWTWGFDIRVESGRRKRESGFGTRQLAEVAVARIRLSEKEGKYNLTQRDFPFVGDVCRKRTLRIENQKEKVRAVTVLERWLAMLAPDLKLSELSAVHIRLYIDARAKSVKASSVNREVTIIASALHSAHVDFPEIESWVCPPIPRPKVSRSRRERLITQEEVLKLLTFLLSSRRTDETVITAANRRIVGQAFQMTLLTGARIGEITALRWDRIDFKAKMLQIVGTKTRFHSTKMVRYLEITPTIESILLERKEISNWEYVFCRTGNSITDYHKILRETAHQCGITYGKFKRGGFITHDARHTAITRMLQAGVDLSTIGSITGHSDANLILHYSHATRESRKQAVSILEDFVNGEADQKKIKPTNKKKKAS